MPRRDPKPTWFSPPQPACLLISLSVFLLAGPLDPPLGSTNAMARSSIRQKQRAKRKLAPGQRAIKEARRRFKRGVILYKDGDYRAALAEFHRSNELRPHSLTIYNIATCYNRLGEYAEAIRHYRRTLRSKPRLSWSKRRRVKREIKRLRSLLAFVKISLNVRRATLILNGKKYSISDGHRIRLPAGIHTLTVKAPGYTTLTRQVTLAGGTVSGLDFRLSPATRLHLQSSTAGARVLIDGQEVGDTPYSGDVQPGPIRVRVTKPGYLPWERTLSGKAGRTLRVDVQLDDPRKGLPQYWFWSTAGASVALGIASLALGLRARGLQDDYDGVVNRIQGGDYESPDELRTLQDQGKALQDDLKRFTAGTNVCLGLTAAAAAAAVTLAFFTRFKKPRSKADISLTLLPGGGAGLVAGGRFR